MSCMLKQQSTVATLSTHAEYIAGTEVLKELVWLQHLLSELHESISKPMSCLTLEGFQVWESVVGYLGRVSI